MATRQISRNQWVEFFNNFSKQHQGWLSTLEIIGDDIGDQEEASGLPLVGISADLKDNANRIEVILGGRPDSDLTRILNDPKTVWFKDSQEAGNEAIEIDTADGSKTVLSFGHFPGPATERQLPAGD
jgi:hypothetical protein